MPATKLVLWRHGVTDWNERGLFQGQTDIPLNDRGLGQAAAAAPYLAEFAPVAVYSSPMQRAQQTAHALTALIGQTPIIDPRLAEIDVGSWVGKNLASTMADDPVVRAAVQAGNDYRRSPSGETMTEVGRRAGDSLREIASRHSGQVVVAVSHGGAIRMGIANLLEWTHWESIVLAGVANCGWCVLNLRYGRWRIEAYNRVASAPDPSANTEI